MPSSRIRFLARIRFAFSHENTKALIITPAITAIAKSKITVNAETATKTITSLFGILFKILKLDQAKVPITTINITPTKAAIGTCSINPEANKIKANNVNAATIPDNLPRPPPFMLISDCPIMAHPPIPPKSPVTMFAPPCAKHSLLEFPLVSVSSSTKFNVIKDSIKPIAAKIKA